MVERSLFRAKINSDYNDFEARVALEVVDSALWKQQLGKSAGSGTTSSHRMREHRGSRYSPSRVSGQ
jgi:hypothetical protein